jgi:hypothetical protein
VTGRVLLPILWAVLLLPSSNIGWFDGLPLDAGPELIGVLLLLPLTVSRGLRRHFQRAIGARSRGALAILAALGLVAVGGKLALLASGTHEGFLGCYRFALEPPPTGPCERSFANPWFRHAVTRIDRAIDFNPETWNLGFLNSRRFNLYGRRTPGRPLRDRIPLEVTWRGLVAQPSPWIARVTYVGEVTLRLGRDEARADASEVRLPARYGEAIAATVPVPAGRHLLELVYRFDDGARWPAPQPSGPWATLRLERGDRSGSLVGTARPPMVWRALAAIVDSAVVVLGASLALGYGTLVRRDWRLVAFVAVAGPVAWWTGPAVGGLPTTLGVFLALTGLAFALFGRPWRRRLLLAFFAAAYLNVCLVLSSTPRLEMVVYRQPATDALFYESQARVILETWSLEGGEAFFRYQPGFRYWRFLERLALGEGDPLIQIVGLTLLEWGYLWAIARLWPRPAPPLARALPFALAVGLILSLATSTPVRFFVEAPLSEYPTWLLLPLSFTLVFASRRPRGWVGGGILGGVAVLCRLNHIPAFLGYLVVFARRRWRDSPRAVALTVAVVLAMLTLPSVHNRYYGGPALEARRILNINRVALAISPSRLTELHRDPGVRRALWEQVLRVLYLHTTRNAPPQRDRFSRLTIRGIQWLWAGTVIVAFSRRRLAVATKALLLVPLLYLGVHLLYSVSIYYPRHIIAGHFALGVSVLYTFGRGWAARPTRAAEPALPPATSPRPESGYRALFT